jgi:hypothetical protein
VLQFVDGQRLAIIRDFDSQKIFVDFDDHINATVAPAVERMLDTIVHCFGHSKLNVQAIDIGNIQFLENRCDGDPNLPDLLELTSDGNFAFETSQFAPR